MEMSFIIFGHIFIVQLIYNFGFLTYLTFAFFIVLNKVTEIQACFM